MRQLQHRARRCARVAALAATMWCACSLHGATTPLTIKNMKGSVSWTARSYGRGSFSVLATVPTTVTNLHQLSLSQPSFFTRAGWLGLNAWEDWVTTDSATRRSYRFKGSAHGKNFGYSVTLALQKGVLTITMNGSARGYVADMLALSDTTSNGVATHLFTVDLKDANGMTAIAATATVQMDCVNKAGMKSSASLVKN